MTTKDLIISKLHLYAVRAVSADLSGFAVFGYREVDLSLERLGFIQSGIRNISFAPEKERDQSAALRMKWGNTNFEVREDFHPSKKNKNNVNFVVSFEDQKAVSLTGDAKQLDEKKYNGQKISIDWNDPEKVVILPLTNGIKFLCNINKRTKRLDIIVG